jgi:hypothetical protein
MTDAIQCICGYRGPSIPDGAFRACPICRGRAAGGPEPATPRPPLADDDQRPVGPSIFRIPCPAGHVLKAREDMLGQQVCCPECNAFFVLRAVDSVEFREEQARLRAEAEERAAQTWLRRAFWLAVIVAVSFIVMLAIGVIWG